MKIDLNINFLISKISQSASKDRKIVGGTYKTLFFFTGIADYFQIYGNGLYQAVGRDDEHTYFKTWNNSSFAGVEPQDIFKQLGSFINRIETYGCGNEYKKTFPSFKKFLEWIEVNPLDAGIQITEEASKADEKKTVVIIDNIDQTKDETNKITSETKNDSTFTPDKETVKSKEENKEKTPAEETEKKEIPSKKSIETNTEKNIGKEEIQKPDMVNLNKPVVIIDNNIMQTDNELPTENNLSGDQEIPMEEKS